MIRELTVKFEYDGEWWDAQGFEHDINAHYRTLPMVMQGVREMMVAEADPEGCPPVRAARWAVLLEQVAKTDIDWSKEHYGYLKSILEDLETKMLLGCAKGQHDWQGSLDDADEPMVCSMCKEWKPE